MAKKPDSRVLQEWRARGQLEKAIIYVLHAMQTLEEKGLVTGGFDAPRLAGNALPLVEAMLYCCYRPSDGLLHAAVGCLMRPESYEDVDGAQTPDGIKDLGSQTTEFSTSRVQNMAGSGAGVRQNSPATPDPCASGGAVSNVR